MNPLCKPYSRERRHYLGTIMAVMDLLDVGLCEEEVVELLLQLSVRILARLRAPVGSATLVFTAEYFSLLCGILTCLSDRNFLIFCHVFE